MIASTYLPESSLAYVPDPSGIAASVGLARLSITPFAVPGGVRDSVFIVFARMEDGSGRTGFGYSQFLEEDDAAPAVDCAAALVERCGSSLPGLLRVEDLAADGGALKPGSELLAAANAVSLAAWDVHGRQHAVPCASMWGGTPRALSCYDSGILAFSRLDEIEAAIGRCRAANFKAAKLAVGGADVEADLARIRKAQGLLGPGALAIDAVRRWSAEQVDHVLSHLAEPLLWFEDPLHYDEIGRIAGRQPVAVGEISHSLTELERLAGSGGDYILPDLGCIGGPLRFLHCARRLEAGGTRIGSHSYSRYSVQLLCCLENPLPVEVMDWGSELFLEEPLRPGPDGTLPEPGHGLGAILDDRRLRGAVIREVELA